MGWNNDIFPLLIVVSGPPFTGLFVYSPAPGTGNLVASISASAGTDPYGNHYNAGITSYDNTFGGVTNILGAVISLFSGVTERALLSPSSFTVFNSSGATIYNIDLARAAQFLYADTGSAAQGALIASEAQASGTDQFGNAYRAGISSYTATQIASLLSGGVDMILRGATPSTADTTLQPAVDGSGLALGVSSGGISTDTTSTLFLGDSAATHTGLQVVWGKDGNTYDTERLSKFTSGTQLINSTTPATITGLSKTVAAATYRVEGIVYGIQGPAAAGQTVQFNGPAISFGRMYIESNADGNTSVTDSNLSGAFPEVHVTPAWGSGVNFYVRFKGIYTFTAAGTFSVQAASNTNTNTWTSQAACLLDIFPVVAS